MADDAPPETAGTVLLIGASRGLGYAMTAAFVAAGWSVVGTVRGGAARTPLHDLADAYLGRVEIEQLDITAPDDIAGLRNRLAAWSFDMLFVNAGTATGKPNQPGGETLTEDFTRAMVTNALGPMRVIEQLQDLISPDGLIGVMSSGQGSIANNAGGGQDVYRASKAALNMFMRSYAARHADSRRALVLLAPGWIRTALGGANAPISVEEAMPQIMRVLLAQRGVPGLRFVDRDGRTVPW